ncbi:MAG: dihydrolipoyl dehydrogenase [Firmicutes bacterium]|nr:dihydrolipoyl dehydrogenase [Bacillota bacterium]
MTYNLIVIGAGPGGYEAALEASEKGMKVALVEKDKLGGTCLNRGCVPTKTLMHTADIARELKDASKFGVNVSEYSVDAAKMQERKNEVLDTLRSGIAALMKKGKIDVYEGLGVIEGSGRVRVGDEILETENILIATGSKTFVPPIEGVDIPGVVTSDELLDKADGIYEHLVIVGGGVIGMEFASLYAALGTKVTIIEALERVLAPLDKEISQNVKMIGKKRGMDIHAKARVEKFAQGEDGKLITYYSEKDELQSVESDGVLVCIGRRANTDGLFADGVAVEMDRDKIVVNDKYQTSLPGVYAIGDVIGGIQLAHVATAEGRNAVAVMNGDEPSIRMDTVPSCVYTNPEIATVGITADEAKAAGLDVVTKKYIMSANGKSVLSDQERGFIKVVADAESKKLLGAQMMCARATDMIGELAVAVGNGLTLDDVANIIHPHPTFVEGINEAVR